MSSWAAFRKTWIKPEVYPLIGSMAAAVLVCGAAMTNKIRDPTVTWNKSKRAGGTSAVIEDIDEVVPMWSRAKNSSTEIFSKATYVMDSKHIVSTDGQTFTVTVGEPEEEPEEAPEEEESAEEVETPVAAALEVVDEAAETINAAVDAAIESAAAAVAETKGTAASSVAEAPEIETVSLTPQSQESE